MQGVVANVDGLAKSAFSAKLVANLTYLDYDQMTLLDDDP
jgi:hypothetical protein